MYFLALSQAPPVLENEMAICTPLTMLPANTPLTASVPNNHPNIKGVKTTSIPGATIFFREALVEMAMHLS